MTEKKAPRKTRERILTTALSSYNNLGEANVSVAHLCETLTISPGNLYYHFASKEDITAALFKLFEAEMRELLWPPDNVAITVEDMWLFLHLMFETISRYRFLYRDINDLIMRNRTVETGMQRILQQTQRVCIALCEALARGGDFTASAPEIRALATNMTLISTYWLSFEHARHPRSESDIGAGVYQVMSLTTPFLQGDARLLLTRLSESYVAR
ncbi:TetR/AcrR family transcriptional regulator [Burkholderiaceae bacterium DAT-1]|nr:TetR/AcrR family transcriptional regulator [Burkholderiaceae bacterium DAT-1]